MSDEIAVRALQVAAILYIAHESVAFDTEQDAKQQEALLMNMNRMCPELKMVVAGLKEKDK